MQSRKAVTIPVEEPSRRARSRREFLQTVCAGGVACGLGAQWLPRLRADDAEALPAGSRLIVRTAKPLNAEPPLDELVRDWLTPVESFYIRNHGATPHLDGANFRLTVEGLVDRPIELSAAELA